ncbi:cobalamin-dependent protein [uncultured Paludibaculum sp.]|uniref:B12-binding domain-containing radical SAM protein n=1 Tax=uncultured Paludibaculum sp. TaxID=1765020 RepID=UPI002AAB6771|nr:cobalamin-dependent protein [uncultured Paludibaculum sp.]
MRILLISANALRMSDGRRWCETPAKAAYAATTLTLLAALIPPELGAEVAVVDEAVDAVPDDFWSADLVGISAMTCDAQRAYQLADAARSRGVKVVLGGYHPTFMPDEALLHADAVVRGFAEAAWPQLLREFSRGAMRPLYQSVWHDAFASGVAVPRRDLLHPRAYSISNTLETARGCANSCNFCVVPPMHAGRFVPRSIDRIQADLESMPAGPIAMLDANPLENSTFAATLLPVLKRVGRRWFSSASMKSASDATWVKAARASGCRGLVIGFESLDVSVLSGAGKSFNDVTRYRETCRMLHGEGIAILGCFVFGLDGDDASVFSRTVEFVDRNHLDVALYSIFTPFPGTAAWSRVRAHGRILTTDWNQYDGRHVVYQPIGMTVDELQQGLYYAWNETYRLSSILRRVAGSRAMPLADLAVNLGFRYYRRTFVPVEVKTPQRGGQCEFS